MADEKCSHPPPYEVQMRHRNGTYEWRQVCGECGTGITAWHE